MAGIELPAEQKAQLDNVAQKLLAIYETLAHMRFLIPEEIQRGPHPITDELQKLYDELELDPSVIYLYSILPYVTPADYDAIFFQGSQFADFRREKDVRRGRDPLYCSPSDPGFDDPDGPYMRPWFTPLAPLGNHDSTILYDARKNRIWIIDHESGSSSDPGPQSRETMEALQSWEPEDRGEGDQNDEENEQDNEDEDDEQDSDEEDDDDDENCDHDEEEYDSEEDGGPNDNDLRKLDSRPAPAVLADILTMFRRLRVLPGGKGAVIGSEYKLSKEMNIPELYRRCGWPDEYEDEADFQQKLASFQGDIFEADLARWTYVNRACGDANKLMYNLSVKRDPGNLDFYLKKLEDTAPDTEEGWLVRTHVFFERLRRERTDASVEWAQKALDDACPGGSCIPSASDLPLWELKVAEEAVERYRREAAESAAASREKESDRIRAQHAQHRLDVHVHALARSKKAAEECCPGRSTDEVRDILACRERVAAQYSLKDTRSKKEALGDHMAKMEAWTASIPQEFDNVRLVAEGYMNNLRQQLELQIMLLKRYEEQGIKA